MWRLGTLLALSLAVGLLSPSAGTAGSTTAAQSAAVAAATGATAAGSTTTPAPAPETVASPSASDDAVVRAAARTAGDQGGDAVPLPFVLLAALLVVGALAAAVWVLARQLAWDPPWLAKSRHAAGEAGWRASAAWAEFSDWVRFGG